MVTNLTLLTLSLFALYIGADWLVKGSTALALKARITPLVIGLTVVAFGTSAPELVVSLNASLSGKGDIAVGNVVGSNIFNICLILGISAMICPLRTKQQLVRRDIPILLLATVLFTALFWNGTLGRTEGVAFTGGILLYTLYSLYYSRKQQRKEQQIELGEQTSRWYTDLLYMGGGLAVLLFGSQLLIDNATLIARHLGISEAVIALTIVAAGTSMPELATSIVAAIRKNPEIALGNAVGSNLFNILAILGLTAWVRPIRSEAVNHIDLLVMLGSSLLLLPLAWTRFRISRWEGGVLAVAYLFYTGWLLRGVL